MRREDAAFMAEALRLAEKGLYTCQPNPRVGAVIVKDGVVAGRGYHLKDGEGHAEAIALQEAGESARGATVYCTLEPCSFQGRTPSCARSLVAAGVARVVVGMEDPHVRNAGKGLAILRDAGIEVECGLMESSARALNPGHIKRFEQGLPYVRLKLAMSLDGKTALENGESRWITGAPARRDVQKLRARSSAIVTGVQTVIDDDPSLTVRSAELDVAHATLSASIERPIVILDPDCRIDRSAKVLKNPDAIVACLKTPVDDTAPALRVMILPPNGEGRIDLDALLRNLAGMQCNEVLFECGATLAGALVESAMVDEIVIYAAPTLLGADARSLLGLAKIDSMQDRVDLTITDIRQIGRDIRMTCSPGAAPHDQGN